MLNALLDSGKQVVVAADRPPAELEGVDERVRSRLKGGVVVGVAAPDLVMRRRILESRFAAACERNPRCSSPMPCSTTWRSSSPPTAATSTAR